jgi:hypothetical protein
MRMGRLYRVRDYTVSLCRAISRDDDSRLDEMNGLADGYNNYLPSYILQIECRFSTLRAVSWCALVCVASDAVLIDPESSTNNYKNSK